MVFEWFAELLMNTTRETVEPAMHAAAEDICGDYPDIVPNDTRNLMGFFVSVRRLLVEVCCDALLLLSMTDPRPVRRQRFYLYRSDQTDT
jgi:kinetochore protein Nuf2